MCFELPCVLVHALDAQQPLLRLAEKHQIFIMVATLSGVVVLTLPTLTVILTPRIMAQLAAIFLSVDWNLRSFRLLPLRGQVVEPLTVRHLLEIAMTELLDRGVCVTQHLTSGRPHLTILR